MMMMMQQLQQQQQQQQQKLMRPSNQLEIQFAYQDAWRVCHPDFKRPFASLEDACERRTHSQITQVIREYRKTGYRVPMAVLVC
ncbi:unnamed protein product [Arabidopsis halleri]